MSQSASEHVAAEVRAEMGRQDRDNAWLAAKLDVSEMWVSRRLRCVTEWSVNDLVATAEALDVSPSQFLPVPARAS